MLFYTLNFGIDTNFYPSPKKEDNRLLLKNENRVLENVIFLIKTNKKVSKYSSGFVCEIISIQKVKEILGTQNVYKNSSDKLSSSCINFLKQNGYNIKLLYIGWFCGFAKTSTQKINKLNEAYSVVASMY